MTIFAITDAVLVLTGAVAISVALATLLGTVASRPVPKPVIVRVRNRRR